MAYQGPISDHFDGKQFYNLEKTTKTVRNFLKWQFQRKLGPWPNWIDLPSFPLPPQKVDTDELLVTFINHATVLIQTAGLNILTDPIWSKRCSPISWLGPKRVHNPGIALADLPPIDIALISHDHYDHLDIPTLKKLQQHSKPKFIAGLGINPVLQANGRELSSTDLDWWQELTLANGVKITFVPARHWSARSPLNSNTTLWGGFVISTPHHKVYYSGDTAMGRHFQLIQQHFEELSLAILPIGAYEPRWFMDNAHINPEEALIAYQTLNARYGLGVHHNTFAHLADEAYDQPLSDLSLAKEKLKLSSKQFRTLLPGESWLIS
ncbi:MAG: twin-arginine translocation pathway signal [Gammaproteobacteria bacterium]|jgi:L-ascorbate metabolism protein UlaG (beta-lactamase superfamily)|nr:twin-arginine translocation pathway signal [Gammaproteobacteria bacterium]